MFIHVFLIIFEYNSIPTREVACSEVGRIRSAYVSEYKILRELLWQARSNEIANKRSNVITKYTTIPSLSQVIRRRTYKIIDLERLILIVWDVNHTGLFIWCS